MSLPSKLGYVARNNILPCIGKNVHESEFSHDRSKCFFKAPNSFITLHLLQRFLRILRYVWKNDLPLTISQELGGRYWLSNPWRWSRVLCRAWNVHYYSLYLSKFHWNPIVHQNRNCQQGMRKLECLCGMIILIRKWPPHSCCVLELLHQTIELQSLPSLLINKSINNMSFTCLLSKFACM